MKIEVNKEGKILIDNAEVLVDQITPQVLENILNEGLENNVEFILPEDTSHPVASLMKELSDLTEKDSDFRKKIDEVIKEKEENDKKIEISEKE